MEQVPKNMLVGSEVGILFFTEICCTEREV
jgi:hypothetical protein